jgi:hypothetical protein
MIRRRILLLAGIILIASGVFWLVFWNYLLAAVSIILGALAIRLAARTPVVVVPPPGHIP